MITENETTMTEIRDNAYETTPVFWWGWPNEVLLTDFAEQDVQIEQDAQAEKDDHNSPLEDNPQYAALYFIA